MQWEKSQAAGKGARWRTKPAPVCARAQQMAHGRHRWGRCCCVLGFGRNSRVARMARGRFIVAVHSRLEFLPERKPSLVHDQRSALSAEGGEEEDRELGLWAEVGSRGGLREDARGEVDTPRCPAWLRNSHWSPPPRADSRNLVLPTMPD